MRRSPAPTEAQRGLEKWRGDKAAQIFSELMLLGTVNHAHDEEGHMET